MGFDQKYQLKKRKSNPEEFTIIIKFTLLINQLEINHCKEIKMKIVAKVKEWLIKMNNHKNTIVFSLNA